MKRKEEEKENKGIIYFREGKKKKLEFQINDIIDDEDGIDFERKEIEIKKLMKKGMNFKEAENYLNSIGWDGKESINIIKVGNDFHVQFGKEEENEKRIQKEKEQIQINSDIGKSDNLIQINRNEIEIKKRLKEIEIKREFEDGQKQKKYERYLEQLGQLNNQLNLFSNEERLEFSGIAIGRLLIGKQEQNHLNWLSKFVKSNPIKQKENQANNKIERTIQNLNFPKNLIERFL